MTILVVFGEPVKFDAEHGQAVYGNDMDCIYFAVDRFYDESDVSILPAADNETMLPVIQHKSGSDKHISQLVWLGQAGAYNPVNVGKFSHDVDDLFRAIKQLFATSGEQDTNNHQTRVTSFVKQYGNRAILEYMDKCAAWTALFEISGNQDHENEMLKYRGLVQPLITRRLNRLSCTDQLSALEEAAASFC